jgi:hypothetical protein
LDKINQLAIVKLDIDLYNCNQQKSKAETNDRFEALKVSVTELKAGQDALENS